MSERINWPLVLYIRWTTSVQRLLGMYTCEKREEEMRAWGGKIPWGRAIAAGPHVLCGCRKRLAINLRFKTAQWIKQKHIFLTYPCFYKRRKDCKKSDLITPSARVYNYIKVRYTRSNTMLPKDKNMTLKHETIKQKNVVDTKQNT